MADFSATARTEEGFDIETNARSQESMDRIHGQKPDKPAEKAPEPAAKAPDKPADAPEAPKTPDQPKKGEQEPPEGNAEADEDEKLSPNERRNKAQERIDRLTRERRAEERRRIEVERKLDEIQRRADEKDAELRKFREKFPDAAKPQDPDAEPDVADFEDVEEFKKSYRSWAVRQDAQERETKAKTEARQAAVRERLEAFESRIFEPAKANPSLLEGLPADLVDSVPLSAMKPTDKVGFGNFIMEVLTRVKEPWLVLNHFKTQAGQDELQRLSTLHPSDVTMEIGMLYKDLSSANKTAPEEKPKPEISKAKPPGKAISSGPPSDLDPYAEGIDFDEAARREAALKRRR